MTLLDRAVSLGLPFVPKPLVRRFSRRYIAGTTVDHALAVVRDLRRQGALSTIDILGEFVTRREEAARNAVDYVRLLERLHAEGLVEANVSVKLSALGLLLDRQACLAHMRALCEVARSTRSFVRIDMEDSSCTSPTIEIYKTLRAEYGSLVGVVLQSRLRRTLRDVDEIAREPSNFRLCKGIYIEPRTIAYKDPEIIRRNFMHLVNALLTRGCYVGIATHDERLVWEGLRAAENLGLEKDRYEFQMLLGVDEEMRRILVDAGHRLRVYVPFGPQWYAYSMRRLRENPRIARYVIEAMLRGK